MSSKAQRNTKHLLSCAYLIQLHRCAYNMFSKTAAKSITKQIRLTSTITGSYHWYFWQFYHNVTSLYNNIACTTCSIFDHNIPTMKNRCTSINRISTSLVGSCSTSLPTAPTAQQVIIN